MEERRKWDRAKRLTNIAEYPKAMSALLSNGTATISETVLSQLRSKHPRRTRPITRPRPPHVEFNDLGHQNDDDDEWDMLLPIPTDDRDHCHGHRQTHVPDTDHRDLRNDDQRKSQNSKMDFELDQRTTDPGRTAYTGIDSGMDITPDEKKQTVRGTPGTAEIHEQELNAPLNFPSLTVTAQDIRNAVKGVRRLTSGGLQQKTPYHLNRAILATSNEDCATAATHLATR